MATKIICDICGKDVPDSCCFTVNVKGKGGIPGDNMNQFRGIDSIYSVKENDLCQDCAVMICKEVNNCFNRTFKCFYCTRYKCCDRPESKQEIHRCSGFKRVPCELSIGSIT